jgi:hypothetical protein
MPTVGSAGGKMIASIVRPSALLTALAIFAACSSEGDAVRWAGKVDTLANGAISIQDPSVGAWKPSLAWSPGDSLRIGSLDNENTAFSRVSDLAVDRRGQVYVLELGGTSVRVFGPDGNLLQVIGTRGSGPDEILSAAGMEVDEGDRLWLADAGNARYTVFNPDGSVARSQRWQEVGMMLPRPIAFDRSGSLLAETAVRIGTTSFQDVLLWLDEKLKEVARLEIPLFDREVYELRNPEGRLREIIAVPFAPWLVWSVGLAGEVWMGVNDRYALARVTMTGDTTLILSREASPMKVTAEEKLAALEGFRPFLNGGGRIDDSRIPRSKPLFQSVLVDDDAHIWVRRYVEDRETGSLFDIFDPNGRYLGEFKIPYDLEARPRPLVRQNHLYGVILDDLDVPYVVRVQIKKPGSP